MGRWEPNGQARLREAAMALFDERGYEQTTVAEIAARAGLTSRTFFRYFADKREVLFGGSEILQQAMVDAVASAPAEATPMQVVAAGMGAAAEVIGGRREFSQQRQLVINANPALQERELIKMSTLSAALGVSLRDRGVVDATAGLAAEAGVAVFRVAFERWINATDERSLSDVVHDSFDDLRALT